MVTKRRVLRVFLTGGWARSRHAGRRWTRWRVCWSCSTPAISITPKHFHEKLVAGHGITHSYNRVRLTLQAHGRVMPAPRRGAHRRKRPRRPMKGMMLHQDGSRHEWVPGESWDLIFFIDEATSEIYSAFFVAEEGTMSTFRALTEVIAGHGLFCALYADRGSHYWHTPPPAARWTGTIRRRSAGRSASSASS